MSSVPPYHTNKKGGKGGDSHCSQHPHPNCLKKIHNLRSLCTFHNPDCIIFGKGDCMACADEYIVASTWLQYDLDRQDGTFWDIRVHTKAYIYMGGEAGQKWV